MYQEGSGEPPDLELAGELTEPCLYSRDSSQGGHVPRGVEDGLCVCVTRRTRQTRLSQEFLSSVFVFIFNSFLSIHPFPVESCYYLVFVSFLEFPLGCITFV